MIPTVEEVIEALDEVIDPCSVGSAVPLTMREMGLIEDLAVSDAGDVAIRLRMSSPGCLMGGYYFEPRIKAVLGRFDAIRGVSISFGDPLTWTEAEISETGRRKLAEHRRSMAAKPLGSRPVAGRNV